MVKHTQTIADELFECVWPFCEIGAKRLITHLLYDPANFWFRTQALPQIGVAPERYPMINIGNINWNSKSQKILLTSNDKNIFQIFFTTSQMVYKGLHNNILQDTKKKVWKKAVKVYF